MEKLSSHSSQPRKPYLKPQLRKVDLKPEEAVLGNCKTNNITAGPTPTCATVGNCSTLGS
jgi:hypothetical protein